MERVWGIRTGRAEEIISALKLYLQEHPDNFYGDVDTLLELIYFHYTDYSPVETSAYGQFLRTAGPHFPASQRHNKRTVKFQAIKPYAAKGALHE